MVPDNGQQVTEAIIRDISERKTAQATIEQQTEELRNLIDVAAHELRHPATIFKGYSYLLLEKRDTLSSQAFDDAIRSIEEAATRVTRLVNDLFDASRIERGKMGIKREEVQPGKLLLRAVAEMRVKGCERDFVLSTHDEVTELRADGERIKQVLWILLDNDEREPHKGRVRAPACLHGGGEGRHQEEARRAGDTEALEAGHHRVREGPVP